MGYYSEVAIALPKEDFNKLEELCKKAEQEKEFHNSILDYSNLIESEDYVILHWDSTKWYRDFYDVGLIMGFLENEASDYSYMRVGEDWEDIVYEPGDKGFFSLNRDIDLTWRDC